MKKGFTLIEIMIVVVIVGILTAIAYPSYTSYVMKARRSDGQSSLMELASKLERYYSEHHTYATATINVSTRDMNNITNTTQMRLNVVAELTPPTSANVNDPSAWGVSVPTGQTAGCDLSVVGSTCPGSGGTTGDTTGGTPTVSTGPIAPTDPNESGPLDTAISREGFYTLSIVSADASSFSIQAAPRGSQVNDTQCGTLTYNNLGQKGITGTGTVKECW